MLLRQCKISHRCPGKNIRTIFRCELFPGLWRRLHWFEFTCFKTMCSEKLKNKLKGIALNVCDFYRVYPLRATCMKLSDVASDALGKKDCFHISANRWAFLAGLSNQQWIINKKKLAFLLFIDGTAKYNTSTVQWKFPRYSWSCTCS